MFQGLGTEDEADLAAGTALRAGAHLGNPGLRGAHVNAQPGPLYIDREGRLASVMILDIADGQAQAGGSIVNLDKLQHLGPVVDLRAPQRSRTCMPTTIAGRSGRPSEHLARPPSPIPGVYTRCRLATGITGRAPRVPLGAETEHARVSVLADPQLTIWWKRNSAVLAPRFSSVASPATSTLLLLQVPADPKRESDTAATFRRQTPLVLARISGAGLCGNGDLLF